LYKKNIKSQIHFRRMHSLVRELTYSVVRNYQQKLLNDKLRICPSLMRTYADDKDKGVPAVPSAVTSDTSVETNVAVPPPLSYPARRREVRRQKAETMSLVKEIIAENDR
jgi:hypothetical protein